MNFNSFQPIFISVVFFLLASHSITAQETYESLEQQLQTENDSLQNRFFALRLGFSHMPNRLSEASVSSDVPFLPPVDADVSSVNLSNGLNLGMHYFLDEHWYTGMDIAYFFSSNQQGRRNDNMALIALTGGYQFPLMAWSKDYLLSVEAGFGARIIDRPLTGIDGYRITLTRMDYVFTPTVRYEINIFKEKLYAFAQARYYHQLGTQNSRSGLRYERRREDIIDLINLNDFDVIASPGARLDIGNTVEFSVGLRINL